MVTKDQIADAAIAVVEANIAETARVDKDDTEPEERARAAAQRLDELINQWLEENR